MYPRDIDYLKAILESATRHALLVTDNTGVIRLHNSAAAAIFHYRRDELVGLSADRLFTPEDLEQDVPHRVELPRGIDDPAAAEQQRTRAHGSPPCFAASAFSGTPPASR